MDGRRGPAPERGQEPRWTGDSRSGQGSHPNGWWRYGWGWVSGPGGGGWGYGHGSAAQGPEGSAYGFGYGGGGWGYGHGSAAQGPGGAAEGSVYGFGYGGGGGGAVAVAEASGLRLAAAAVRAVRAGTVVVSDGESVAGSLALDLTMAAAGPHAEDNN